jgi:hypothetical protein
MHSHTFFWDFQNKLNVLTFTHFSETFKTKQMHSHLHIFLRLSKQNKCTHIDTFFWDFQSKQNKCTHIYTFLWDLVSKENKCAHVYAFVWDFSITVRIADYSHVGGYKILWQRHLFFHVLHNGLPTDQRIYSTPSILLLYIDLNNWEIGYDASTLSSLLLLDRLIHMSSGRWSFFSFHCGTCTCLSI